MFAGSAIVKPNAPYIVRTSPIAPDAISRSISRVCGWNR
jgi:hypothetical protein